MQQKCVYYCVLRDPYKERKRLAVIRKSLSTHVMLHFPVSIGVGAVAQGSGWKRIAADLGVGVGTVIRHAK
jgi:hypothetical protein